MKMYMKLTGNVHPATVAIVKGFNDYIVQVVTGCMEDI